MRAKTYFAAVDSHTEGMPTRVITGGLGPSRANRCRSAGCTSRSTWTISGCC